ncbi:MFS transporter [Actinomycetota bacterium Odt1-20B]
MRGLRRAAALGNADWHLGAPLLMALCASWDTDVATVTAGIAAYSFGQGLALPLWGWAADRFGPGRSLRAGLTLAAVAAAGSALCPGPLYWVVLRTVAGAGFAAVTPSVSLFFESLRPARTRQRAFAAITTVTATSAIASPLLADLTVRLGSWRLAFAVIALLTSVTAARVRTTDTPAPGTARMHPARERFTQDRLTQERPTQERPTQDRPTQDRLLTQDRPTAGRLLPKTHPRAYGTVIALGAAEGAALLGLPALLAPALAMMGAQAATPAALVLYASGVLAGTLLLRRHARAWQPGRLLAAGGCLAGTGAVLAAALPSPATLLLCAVLLGVGWGYLHTTLQTWLPRLVPEAARARAAALFSASALMSSSAAVALSTGLLTGGRLGAVFTLGTALCAALTCWTVRMARRWT